MAIVWTVVLAAHLAVGWLLTRAQMFSTQKIQMAQPLVLVSLPAAERLRIASSVPVSLVPVGPIVPGLPSIDTLDPNDNTAIQRPIGGTTPPHLEGRPVDPAIFARIAGLKEGVGATVVLRVEVRGSGAVGRVEVDVSGGSLRVDRAAIAYARSLKWVGGRVDGEPETLWIRWGVRLDG